MTDNVKPSPEKKNTMNTPTTENISPRKKKNKKRDKETKPECIYKKKKR